MSDEVEPKEEGDDEDEDEDFSFIATHPRAQALLAKSLSVEGKDDTDLAVGTNLHGGKRKRSKGVGGKRFEALGGMYTARRPRTSASSIGSSRQDPCPLPSETFSDPVSDPVRSSYNSIVMAVNRHPELAQTYLRAQELSRAISDTVQRPVAESPSVIAAREAEETARKKKKMAKLLISKDDQKYAFTIAADKNLEAFFKAVREKLQLQGEWIFKTDWGSKLAPTDTAESAGLADESVIIPVFVPAPLIPVRPSAARVLDLDVKEDEGGSVVIDGSSDNDEEIQMAKHASLQDIEERESEVAIVAVPTTASISGTSQSIADAEEEEQKVRVKFSLGPQKVMTASIPRTDTFDCIQQRFCAKQSMDPKKVIFKFDGRSIDLKKTPEDLEVDDDDIIDVLLSK